MGKLVGSDVGEDTVGVELGSAVGIFEVGSKVGNRVGKSVGGIVGNNVGLIVGRNVGLIVGRNVGFNVGAIDDPVEFWSFSKMDTSDLVMLHNSSASIGSIEAESMLHASWYFGGRVMQQLVVLGVGGGGIGIGHLLSMTNPPALGCVSKAEQKLMAKAEGAPNRPNKTPRLTLATRLGPVTVQDMVYPVVGLTTTSVTVK